MLTLQNISYTHPNKNLLFHDLHLTVKAYDKSGLIGINGSGKSTLLKIIAGELPVSSGHIHISGQTYYVPQIFGQYNHLTIGQALQVDKKLNALKEILGGNLSTENFTLLNDDWAIEERCHAALNYWNLTGLDLSQKMEALSGGQKTKVLLAGILIHQPELILLDEPTNHLDGFGRRLLYDFIKSSKNTILVVSHDRKLLNLLNSICELTKEGIKIYGGNYDFYKEQKQIETKALDESIHAMERTLRKAKEKERETMERQRKLDLRGKNKKEKAGVPKVMLNKLRNDSEKSTSKIKSVHEEKITGLSLDLQKLRSNIADIDKIRFGFNNSNLHKGKTMLTAASLNFIYNQQVLWSENLSLEIVSGERIALKGINGSGKTTLIKLILGDLEPSIGNISRTYDNSAYIDQDYSLIESTLTVYEQTQKFNSSTLQEHEIKTRLNRFLFGKEDWDKPCEVLSGGERMRLILCCLTIQNQSPDMIILDEPTNNLDLQNIEILTAAMNEYQGTVLVVSHDDYFLEQLKTDRTITL